MATTIPGRVSAPTSLRMYSLSASAPHWDSLNARDGFFAVYIATFNEWHEGTAFEPMKDHAALLPEELPYGYHNPAYGRYRLDYLKSRLAPIVAG